MSDHKGRDEVFAIIRWDGFHGPDAAAKVRVTVKEVVRSQALAEAEVARLNALNEAKGVHYWWQATRLFPEGRSAGSDVANKPLQPAALSGRGQAAIDAAAAERPIR